MISTGAFSYIPLSDCQLYTSWRFVCLKVSSKSSRRGEERLLSVCIAVCCRERWRFHADRIFGSAPKTKTGSLLRRHTTKKKQNSRSLNLNWTCARGVRDVTDGLRWWWQKKKAFFVWHSKMFLQMEIIPQTALGKCFNKPPIMPCRVIWTRSKIHTISFFLIYSNKTFQY